jgi:hypothetical protein
MDHGDGNGDSCHPSQFASPRNFESIGAGEVAGTTISKSAVIREPHEYTNHVYVLEKKATKPDSVSGVWWGNFHVYPHGTGKEHHVAGKMYCCCNKCGSDYIIDLSGSLKCLKSHLRACNPEAWAECNAAALELNHLKATDMSRKSNTAGLKLKNPNATYMSRKRKAASGFTLPPAATRTAPLPTAATRTTWKSAIIAEPHPKTSLSHRLVKKKVRSNTAASLWWPNFHVYSQRCSKKEHLPHKDYCCCNKCGTDYVVDSSASITSIRSHIQHCNKEAYDECEEAVVKLNMRKSAAPSTPPKSSKAQKKALQDDALIRWVVCTHQDLSVVESESFCSMIRAHNAQAQFMTTEDLKQKIIRLEQDIRKAVLEKLKGRCFAITIEHWTTRGNSKYTGITAHWIENFELGKVTVGCLLHSSDVDALSLEEDYVIDLFTNCCFFEANIVAVVSSAPGDMERFGSMLKERNIPHICCTDHVINSTAKWACHDTYVINDSDVIREERPLQDTPAIKKARMLVGHFHTRPGENGLLISKQQDTGSPKSVIADVCTSWWSKFNTIESLVSLKPVLDSIAEEGKIPALLILDKDEWESLTIIRDILLPFSISQKLLESELNVTVSWVPLMIAQIRNKLQNMVDQDSASPGVLKTMATDLLANYCSRWRNGDANVFTGEEERCAFKRLVGVHPFVCYASAVDPRFKNLPTFKTMEKDAVWDGILKLMVEQVSLMGPDELPQTGANDGTFGQDEQVHDLDDILGEVESADPYKGTDGSSTPMSRCEKELAKYMLIKPLKVFKDEAAKKANIESDPLEWWKLHQDECPILAKLAMRLLCIPATSATSKRIVDLASHVSKCALLDSQIGSTLVFVRSTLEWYDKVTGKGEVKG